MTFPALISITQGTDGTETDTTFSITCPAVLAGDLLLMVAATRYGFNGSGTRPSGWSALYFSNGQAPRADWKIADGTEGGTTLTFSSSSGGSNSHVAFELYVIRGAIALAPTISGLLDNSLGQTFPDITAPSTKDNLWMVWGTCTHGGALDSRTGPTGFTDSRGGIDTGGFEDVGVWRAFRSVNAGSQTGLTYTSSNQLDHSLSFVIQPALVPSVSAIAVIV
jgi:hypothetical protein